MSDARRISDRAWYVAHREQKTVRTAAYYVANREHLLVYARAHRLAHLGEKAAYDRERQGLNRAYVASLKAAPCADCGRTFPPECMDFDHVRGEKFRDVGHLAVASRARLDAEIAKCELVCANCHRTRTKNRRAG